MLQLQRVTNEDQEEVYHVYIDPADVVAMVEGHHFPQKGGRYPCLTIFMRSGVSHRVYDNKTRSLALEIERAKALASEERLQSMIRAQVALVLAEVHHGS